MFQGIFKSAINDANKNYIFGTGSIPIQIKSAQLATFADGTTKQQGYQVAEVNKLISTMLTGWDANGNKPKSMSDNYLELILSCDNGFVVKKRLQFPHIIAWQDDTTPYNIVDVYKEFSIDNWLKADDFENPDITLVVEPTDEILTTSTATPPKVTTTNSGRFYLYYRNLPVGVNRIHIDFNIKTKTEPIDFDLEVIDGLSFKDAQIILSSNEQAKINVLLSGVKDVYKFTGAEGNFEEITMHEWSALYQQIISLAPSNKFTHDLYFYIYEDMEVPINVKEHIQLFTGEGFNPELYVSELFIENWPEGKYLDLRKGVGQFIVAYRNSIFARINHPDSNNKVYSLTVYSSKNNNYPIGTTIGYVVFKDVDGLLALSNYYKDNNSAYQLYARKLSNFPIIQKYLYGIITPETESINISLPDKLYAVVEDTFQLFYRGCIQAVNPYNYNILVSCSKGAQYPRYFQYTPTVSDIGEVTFKITVKNNNGTILGEKSCQLITVSAGSSPSSQKNILCFGDSLTAAGNWCTEAFRRLTGSGGTPAGKAFNNITFCGSKNNAGAGYFGVGGWQWSNYTTQGRAAYRFQVTGVTNLAVGAVYVNNGISCTIMEVNITEGVGNILCSYSGNGSPQSSGILTKTSGSGDETINYTSYAADSQNPLWDYQNNKMTFIPYANHYCNGKIDIVYTLLSWNGQSPWRGDFTSIKAEIRKFADTLHSEFPNAKLKILGIQVNSINGGMGANYGATGTSYADTYGNVVTVLNQNKAYQELANETAYSSFVEFVNVSSQFDSEYNMPYSNVAVNTRSTVMEMRGTNGVHPSDAGYKQIGDIVFRNLIKEICQ